MHFKTYISVRKIPSGSERGERVRSGVGVIYIGFILGLAGSVMNSCLGLKHVWYVHFGSRPKWTCKVQHKGFVFFWPGVSWRLGASAPKGVSLAVFGGWSWMPHRMLPKPMLRL